MDGTTTMSTHERKASIREFYGKFLLLKVVVHGLVVALLPTFFTDI